MKKLLGIALIGFCLWAIPTPHGLTTTGWHITHLFLLSILCALIKPFPLGASTLIILAVGILTQTFSVKTGLSSFSNPVAWLVLMAFFIASGMENSGLGKRLGYAFTALFGKKTLGISYGLAFTDLILAPVIPSVTARSAGIVYPIGQNICHIFHSYPNKNPRLMGEFITLTVFHTTVVTSSLFMTAMAANPILVDLLATQGITITWLDWFLAASVPGMLCFLITPYFIYKLRPPTLKDSPQATELAKQQLKQMGAITPKEWSMIFTMILLLGLWSMGSLFSISPLTAALIGFSVIIITGVISWEKVASKFVIWDTFIWFCVLLFFAKQLTDQGVAQYCSQQVAGWFTGFDPILLLICVCIFYFFSHYLFASASAHVSSMFIPLFLVVTSQQVPPYLAGLLLMFISTLYGGITHYSIAPAPIFANSQYFGLNTFWKIGLIVCATNVLIFMLVGPLWWKVLGYY